MHDNAIEAYQEEVILIYPPTGKDAVTIHRKDLKLLEPDQKLNDSILEFYLRYFSLII